MYVQSLYSSRRTLFFTIYIKSTQLNIKLIERIFAQFFTVDTYLQVLITVAINGGILTLITIEPFRQVKSQPENAKGFRREQVVNRIGSYCLHSPRLSTRVYVVIKMKKFTSRKDRRRKKI